MEANIKHEKKNRNASQSPLTIIARNPPHPYAYRCTKKQRHFVQLTSRSWILTQCHGFLLYLPLSFIVGGRRDRMVIGFKTTCAISAYHHKSCEFESCSWRGVFDTTFSVTRYNCSRTNVHMFCGANQIHNLPFGQRDNVWFATMIVWLLI
jgi:hypothetical protein